MSILNKIIKRKDATKQTSSIKVEKTVAPHIVACKICEGIGVMNGSECDQCKGSGRVIVTSQVTIYITAYKPLNN